MDENNGKNLPPPIFLRDYFAGQAMAGMMANTDIFKLENDGSFVPHPAMAPFQQICYEWADWMIVQSKK